MASPMPEAPPVIRTICRSDMTSSRSSLGCVRPSASPKKRLAGPTVGTSGRSLDRLVQGQAAPRRQRLADVLFGDLAVAGLRQGIPEENALRQLVAGDLAVQPRQQF